MAKLIDLTGQKFDKLTVIEKAPSRKGHVYWKCICDCGRKCEISGESLRRNQPHNCGICELKKIKKEQEKIKKENYLVGKRFGKLTVLASLKERKNNSVVWHCQCDCGNFKDVPTHLLTSNHTQSCGCLKLESHLIDITNQKFGKLTALYFIPKEGKWHCKCECGNECDIDGYNLRNLKSTSCGCINYSIGEKNIEVVLKDNNINYKKEYSFESLVGKNQRKYRFDFAIIQNNQIIRLIEFDGEQHFSSGRGTWKNRDPLKDIQTRDKEKNEWAAAHNIPLVRIPYQERDNITLNMLLGDQYLVKGDA